VILTPWLPVVGQPVMAAKRDDHVGGGDVTMSRGALSEPEGNAMCGLRHSLVTTTGRTSLAVHCNAMQNGHSQEGIGS